MFVIPGASGRVMAVRGEKCVADWVPLKAGPEMEFFLQNVKESTMKEWRAGGRRIKQRKK